MLSLVCIYAPWSNFVCTCHILTRGELLTFLDELTSVTGTGLTFGRRRETSVFSCRKRSWVARRVQVISATFTFRCARFVRDAFQTDTEHLSLSPTRLWLVARNSLFVRIVCTLLHFRITVDRFRGLFWFRSVMLFGRRSNMRGWHFSEARFVSFCVHFAFYFHFQLREEVFNRKVSSVTGFNNNWPYSYVSTFSANFTAAIKFSLSPTTNHMLQFFCNHPKRLHITKQQRTIQNLLQF